jgi:hypothetical protein
MEIEIKKGDKIYILGTGEQAPYGIGEIIDIVPAFHNRRVAEICSRYYNPPALRLNGKTGTRLELVDGWYERY